MTSFVTKMFAGFDVDASGVMTWSVISEANLRIASASGEAAFCSRAPKILRVPATTVIGRTQSDATANAVFWTNRLRVLDVMFTQLWHG